MRNIPKGEARILGAWVIRDKWKTRWGQGTRLGRLVLGMLCLWGGEWGGSRRGRDLATISLSLSRVEFELVHKGCSQCKYLKGKWKCGLRAQERPCPGSRERARPQEQVGWCRGEPKCEREARWWTEDQGGHWESTAWKKRCQGDHRQGCKGGDSQMKNKEHPLQAVVPNRPLTSVPTGVCFRKANWQYASGALKMSTLFYIWMSFLRLCHQKTISNTDLDVCVKELFIIGSLWKLSQQQREMLSTAQPSHGVLCSYKNDAHQMLECRRNMPVRFKVHRKKKIALKSTAMLTESMVSNGWFLICLYYELSTRNMCSFINQEEMLF